MNIISYIRIHLTQYKLERLVRERTSLTQKIRSSRGKEASELNNELRLVKEKINAQQTRLQKLWS